jgi:hypothetical protein
MNILRALPLHQKQTLKAWLTTGGIRHMGLSCTSVCRRLAVGLRRQITPADLRTFFVRTPRRKPVAPAETTAEAKTLSIVIYLHQ